VEGLIVQTAYQVPGDFRDLNVWLLTKLLEDPGRDLDGLVDVFLRGFYGRAAGPLRRYLALLDAATTSPPELTAETDAAAYDFLDAAFLTRAQRIFDEAERAVRRDPVLARRVRHARVALDYAVLVRWHELERECPEGVPFDRARIAARYDATCREQIALRIPEPHRDAEWRRIQDEREDVAP
jgi:hypothetical protein